MLDPPPAERICMGYRALNDEASLCFKSFHDFLVRVLNILALEIRYLLREPSDVVNRARGQLFGRDNIVGDSNTIIVLTKRRRLMDNTRTVCSSNVLISHNAEGFVFELQI